MRWLLLVASVAWVYGTTCSEVPPCMRIRPGVILFTGTPISAEPLPDGSEDRRFRVKVDEAFLGLPAGTREVSVEAGDWIHVGKQYLFDARRGPAGVLSPSTCGATAEVSHQHELVSYLRERGKGRTPTSLSVYLSTSNSQDPISDAVVTIRGSKGELSAKTSSRGYATFDAVLAGSYQLSASKAHFAEDKSLSPPGPVTVVEQSCATAALELLPDGSVAGSLRKSDGSAAVGVRVELAGIDPKQDYPYQARTTEGGIFQFKGVLPGRYVLGTGAAPVSFYPGTRQRDRAIELQVEPGGQLRDLQFALPDAGKHRQIRIRVVDQAGHPVSGAKVSSEPTASSEEFGTIADGLESGADGWVVAEAAEGGSHKLRAIARRSFMISDAVEVPAGPGPSTVILVVRPLKLKP